MDTKKAFTIPFVGLKLGEHHFDYHIDNTFFLDFEYDEFNAADINITIVLDKKSTLLDVVFTIEGNVNVNCDVTNEPFNQPIKETYALVVKFGQEYNDDNDDILIIPHSEYQVNLAQYVYELTVLSLPAKKEHPGIADGTLQSDILKKLEELSPKANKKNKTKGDTDPRWDTLKKLLTDK